jgi:hypothetical protein
MYVGPLSLGHCIACHFPNYRLCGVRVTIPYIEEEQTTQWPKEKVQKDKKSLKIPKG